MGESLRRELPALRAHRVGDYVEDQHNWNHNITSELTSAYFPSTSRNPEVFVGVNNESHGKQVDVAKLAANNLAGPESQISRRG